MAGDDTANDDESTASDAPDDATSDVDATPDRGEDPTGAADFPPLDAVDSRWWYWIAAYPIVLLLVIPVAVVGLILFIVPVAVVGPGADPGPGAGAGFGAILVLVALLVVGLLVIIGLLSFALIVMLPVALYLDARAVAAADVDWQPDPFLYGLLGILQLFVTPVIGIVVAAYYLYKRHVHVGVP